MDLYIRTAELPCAPEKYPGSGLVAGEAVRSIGALLNQALLVMYYRIHTTIAFFILFCISSLAQYVSTSATGSGDGTIAAPWTLFQLTSSLPSLPAGSVVRFRCGEKFEGSIKRFQQNGPITFTSYDSGPKPIISGSTTLESGGWTFNAQEEYWTYQLGPPYGPATCCARFTGSAARLILVEHQHPRACERNRFWKAWDRCHPACSCNPTPPART